jgi:hypothetical protein
MQSRKTDNFSFIRVKNCRIAFFLLKCRVAWGDQVFCLVGVGVS